MAYNSTHTGLQIDSLLDNIDLNTIVNLIYPVGSIYMSINNTSPATLFGGTWVQLKDRFLLGAGDTYTAGSTGGSATMAHTHSLVAGTTGASSAANTGGTAITIAQMPSHTHTFTGTSKTTSSTSKTLTGSFKLAQNLAVNMNGALIVADGTGICSTTNATLNQVIAGNVSVNSYNHPVGISIDATHTHNLTAAGSNSNTGGGDTHTHTMAHTHSISATTTGEASNTNNMPPYLTIYMWKRTA